MAGSRHWKGAAKGLVSDFAGLMVNDSGDNLELDISIDVISAGIVKLPLFGTGLMLNLVSEDTVGKVLIFRGCMPNTMELRYY